eukprot:TRINITY_DN26671_c0_g1_i1.p1 TRINITY_DN26671_c0_g1~~TRINITY_DN26671_c0_g1_i1.p1  ORF type:complete len:310 (+),score=70.08 TRINITY_DN26671_c0_g1_i1:143-1072(+)
MALRLHPAVLLFQQHEFACVSVPPSQTPARHYKSPASSLLLQETSPRSDTCLLRSHKVQSLSHRSRSWRPVAMAAEVESPPAVSTEGASAAASRKLRPGEQKGFVEEMRIRAMRLHTKDQSKEGEKEAETKPLAKWEPTKKGYLQFLVDSKAVYDVLEEVMEKGANPMYKVLRNTGLERSARLAADLKMFEAEGLEIPPPGKLGSEYAAYLKELSETDPPAFTCHFYNVYFAHSAGGRMIGRKVSEMILDGRELEFYKWDGDLQELLSSVKDKLNQVSADWTREEKEHCLEETEKSFRRSGSILRLLVS